MKIVIIFGVLVGITLLSACNDKVSKTEAVKDALASITPAELIPNDNVLSDHLKAMQKARDVEKQLKDALQKRMSIVDGISQ